MSAGVVVNMADWLSLFSALMIVGCFLVLARFIVRLGAMEREAILNVLNPPRMDIPSEPMIGVKNPFVLELKSAQSSIDEMGFIEFLLSTTAPCYVTFYWGVSKDTIDSVLCRSCNKQESSTFDDSENSSDDSDFQEAPNIYAVPLEHILQGSYKERSASEFYDCGSEYNILATLPTDLEYRSLSIDPKLYALIGIVEMSRNDEQGPQQLSDIVALITAIQVSHSSSGKLTSHIQMQYVQTAEGNIFSVKKLFVVESDDIAETQLLPSSQSSSPQRTVNNSPSLSSELTNAVCIICRTLPVTRAFLPCRHACACELCFQQLSYCPMCRGIIQSYYKVQDEPFIDDAESDASSELKQMTMVEIIRGVFFAS